MEEDLNIRKKAELMLGGGIRLPEGFVFPCRVSRSTAGPGAGSASAVFSFGGHRVKKSISYETGEFELAEENGRLSIKKNGAPFLEEVRIEPVVHHCPEQAFFNLDPKCMFTCAFCVSPLLGGDLDKRLSDDDIVEMTRKAVGGERIVSVSLTSGVCGSVDETVGRFLSCVSKLRAEFPDLPIGVEPYVSRKEHVKALKDAGATEIKLNVQSPNGGIFKKVCPELDRDNIVEMLLYSAEVFGAGKVTSNMIFGMGETDAEIEEMTEFLCSKGVIPTFRALRTNPTNRGQLISAIGEQPSPDADRAIGLARMQKEKLAAYGLDTKSCRTMCLECACCDIVPFRDL
ncbi:MAG: radical SAM protein [Candidatus Methanoplasma sp.]|jgi:biotin synthase-related radical SAM superfamily protein|nr:radical SAM protein [Candidatus Methanoplasma sp.]